MVSRRSGAAWDSIETGPKLCGAALAVCSEPAGGGHGASGPKLGLAAGAADLRAGLAHSGVLRAFERANIPVHCNRRRKRGRGIRRFGVRSGSTS